jgi:hypothetical protein
MNARSEPSGRGVADDLAHQREDGGEAPRKPPDRTSGSVSALKPRAAGSSGRAVIHFTASLVSVSDSDSDIASERAVSARDHIAD